MIGKIFSKYAASNAGAANSWPQQRVVDTLKRQFDKVEPIGEDDGFVLYSIADNGVNFVVALITEAASEVAEIGFLARFVGFSVDHGTVDHINRNLHLSVAGLEDNGDLYLLAGIEAVGSYDEGTFLLILEAWRRDLMLVLHSLSGESSLAAAFPGARSETAWRFATNRAPQSEGDVRNLLKSYLGDKPAMAACDECGGRGRRGLVSRTCSACEGTGFVRARGANS